MTSSINANNIDGQFPIAGIDNDSQGFRNNFTNIKNNFTYAANEISDLQTNVLVKAPLSGTDLDNNMRNALLMNAQIKGFTETVVDLGPVNGAAELVFRNGHFQRIQTAGNVTVSFSGWPTSGFYCKMRLWVQVADANHTVTLPTEVSVGIANIAGVSGRTITFPDVGTYLFEFSSYDGGSTVVIEDVLRNYAVIASSLSIDGGMDVASTLSVGGYEILPAAGYEVTTTSSTFYSYPAVYQAMFVDYVYVNTTGVRTGTLTVANNGGIATVLDTGVDAGTPGITFGATVSSGIVDLTQSSVGDGTITYALRRM
jgi:hypothetical protein